MELLIRVRGLAVVARGLVVVALVAACGAPHIKNHDVQCGPDMPACPPSFACGCDGWCWHSDMLPTNCDGGPQIDGARPDAPFPDARTAVCGNSMLEQGETCDPPSSCPLTCPDDGNACTTAMYTGAPGTCNVQCIITTQTMCADGDGCCPPGCNNANDNDCSASCGNGTIEAGETCDPPSSCPTSCSDGNACTTDTTTGSAANCNVSCGHTAISMCANADGCCPGGCTAINDSDCSSTCGNGSVEPGETCDPPSSCPASCNDGNACTIDTMTGAPATCNVACSHTGITTCMNGDGCCPSGCTSGTDNDCSATCGNGVIDPGETCDPPSSCPMTCNDGNACTIDTMTGSAAACNVSCGHTTITSCTNGDGCCPAGCTSLTDNNCSASCGNGIVEAGETCDPPASCPTAASCNDGNPCTLDFVTGSAATCTAACGHSTITTCGPMDGCCPSGCTSGTDPNCSASCGNHVVDPGETCDIMPAIPDCVMLMMMGCNDFNACTIDTLSGSPATCNVVCSHSTITACMNGDGCCPPGCNMASDSDCPPGGGCGTGDAGIGAGGTGVCGDGCCTGSETPCTCNVDCPGPCGTTGGDAGP